MTYPLHPAASGVLAEIARRNIDGAYPMSGLGEADITGSQNGWDVWGGPTQIQPVPASTGVQMEIVSSSAQDAAAGTGIRSVRIYYLDADGNSQSEDIVPTGLTPVNTVATNIRFVQCLQGIGWGSGGVAAGNIDLRSTDGAIVYKRILATGNRRLDTTRMVPAGKRLLVHGWRAGSVGNSRTSLRFRAQVLGDDTITAGFQFQDLMEARDGSGPYARFDPPLLVPALAIVKVSAWTTANAVVSASWRGHVEPL